MSDKRLSLGESAKIFGKALRISVQACGTMSAIVSMGSFIMAFLPVLIALMVRKFSDAVQALYGSGKGTAANAAGVFAMLSALYIAQLLWNSLRRYFEARDSIKIRQFMKERILRCVCDVKYKYIENYDDFKQRISFVGTQAGERVANSMGTTIAWVQNIFTFISVVAALWIIDVWIVAILVAACIPAVIIAYIFSEQEYRNKGFWILEYLMSCAAFFEATMPDALNDVRFFGAFPWLEKRYDEMNGRYIKIKNRVTRKHVLFNSLADIFRSSVYVFILLIAARRIFDSPAIGIGAFMLVFTMAGQLQDVTSKIFVTAAQFVSDAAYMKDFFYLDGLEYEKREHGAKPRESFAVDVNNVSFTYPNTTREVLSSLNVRIREGEKVAIVGENGSGKTTFVNLLCAMYEPDSGSITMGGEDIYAELSRTRRTISAIFQDFARYEASIRENIVISDRQRRTGDRDLIDLTKQTGAWEFIEPQPNGLDEAVGSFSPTGNNLSGGQWQKIAITRCAYRDSAKIMVLDEPTAALDPIAEAEMYRNFAALTGDRTTILVSHRLGITQLVDRILVFDGGRIVEDGGHKALLAQGGLYAKMYRAQAQWYE
jgi:ABC-type multidrug transport system fused ATPase/permease subunit